MTELLILSFLLSLSINGIYIVFNWERMLLEKFGLLLEGRLPEWLCKMLFSCATCMSGIYGLCVFIAMGCEDLLHLLLFVLATATLSTFINLVLECLKSYREKLDNDLGRTTIL